MIKKTTLAGVLLLTVLVLSCLSFTTVFAEENLIASISNPRMILFENMTSDILEVRNSVVINNNNPFVITINLSGQGAWKDNVVFDENEFTVQPGDRKEAFYTLYVSMPGENGGDIQVSFEGGESQNTLSILQRVVVHAQDQRIVNPEKETLGGISWVWIVLVSLVVLVLIVTNIISKKGGYINKRRPLK